ncbi:uncharacterized protein [Watersipora subatra]|uniref:uncharacterized protein n=1 Tax=Watersipora subatra TaxID=2589382 RepID=UPI00355B778A
MGCNSAKMVKVEPQTEHTAVANATKDLDTDSSRLTDKRINSATSNTSKHSRDSAFIEGDGDSIISSTESTRARSGRLKRTLRGLSARSQGSVEPLKDENSVLQQLRSEGLLLERATQKAKSGLSFQLLDETNPHKKPPARLASLQKREKRRKLLTQQDIEAKLQKAEQRRKEAEAERLGKIQSVTAHSDVHNALATFVEHQKSKNEQVQEKVDIATVNRRKKLKELQEKLKQKEEHAALVRERRKNMGPVKILDPTKEYPDE